jgi:hypothetical protein
MNPLLVQGAATLLSGSSRGASMRNLLSMAAAGLVIFAGIGWYMDWYKIQRSPGADGHDTIRIDVNTPEIRKDIANAREKVGEVLGANIPGQTTGYPAPQIPQQSPYPGQGYPTTPYQTPTYPVPNYPTQAPPQQTYPPTGYTTQAPPMTYPPNAYAPSNAYAPPPSGWQPTVPTNRPAPGSYVFPGNPAPYTPVPPAGNSRPF